MCWVTMDFRERFKFPNIIEINRKWPLGTSHCVFISLSLCFSPLLQAEVRIFSKNMLGENLKHYKIWLDESIHVNKIFSAFRLCCFAHPHKLHPTHEILLLSSGSHGYRKSHVLVNVLLYRKMS